MKLWDRVRFLFPFTITARSPDEPCLILPDPVRFICCCATICFGWWRLLSSRLSDSDRFLLPNDFKTKIKHENIFLKTYWRQITCDRRWSGGWTTRKSSIVLKRAKYSRNFGSTESFWPFLKYFKNAQNLGRLYFVFLKCLGVLFCGSYMAHGSWD